MDDAEIRLLAKQEQIYWWHITRRMILDSVLNRFLSRHSGEPAGRLQNRINQSIRSWTSQDDGGNKILDVGCGTDNSSPVKGRLGGVGQNDIKILDVGCGTGENFKWLQNFGEVTGVDANSTAIKLASQQGRAVQSSAENLPFKNDSFNLITAFDVLEHLKDEEQALREWGRVLSSGGLLFLSVPAYQWLFGPHDRALGHYRRYTAKQLLRILHNNGFRPIFSSYIFCLVFPMFLLQRWLAKSSSVDQNQYIYIPAWLNNFLISLGKLEAGWLRFSRFPFGSSIIILARKC